MINNFLNKQAIIKIAFANYSSTQIIVGKITDIDDKFICISFDPTHKENRLHLKNTTGKMIVNSNYLISVSPLNV